MRKIISLAASLLLGVSVFAQYPELIALENEASQSLHEVADRLSAVDPKFAGVKAFGKALQSLNSTRPLAIEETTFHSEAYWRAVMEMAARDPSVQMAQGYLYACNGEVSIANHYMFLAGLTPDDAFKPALARWRAAYDLLRKREEVEIKKGIALHDSGDFKGAIAVYNRVIVEDPFCAWAMYEKGQTLMMLQLKGQATEEQKDAMFTLCRLHDPFFWQAYQGSDPKVIGAITPLISKVQPFISGRDMTVKGLASFAEGCEEIGLIPFAATCQWKLVVLDHENQRAHIVKYLSLIQDAGCPNIAFFRSQFNLTAALEGSKATEPESSQHR